MKKGLYISYYYLPILVPRSIIAFKHLEHSEYDFDVYAANVEKREKDDLLKHNKQIKIIRERKINNVIDKFKYAYDTLKFFKKNKEKYSFIMTSYMPIYSMLAGILIKKKFKDTPWISYYSDPPAINFEQKIKLTKKIFMFLEKYYANKSYKLADMLLFTNQEQLDYCLKNKNEKYKNKAFVLNHSYEESMYTNHNKHKKNNKIIISHFGRLYGERNGLEFLKAIAKIKKENNKLYNQIEIHFFGKISKEHEDIINTYNLDNVKLEGFVNYVDSLKKMKESDYLLCIDAFLEEGENVFFPSKLVDYIGAKKPIIGIVPKEGTSARILKELNMPILQNKSNEIYKYLVDNINKKKNIDTKKAEKYSSINISKYMDTLIKQLIND